MLQESQLPVSVRQGSVIPHFLDERDHPWLRALIDEHLRFVGRRQRELAEHLRQPFVCASPPRKRQLASSVLGQSFSTKHHAKLAAREARAALFEAATTSGRGREDVVAIVAHSLGVSPAELEASLFSDLPGERIVVEPEIPVSPTALALKANLALVQALLFRAASLTLAIEGNARAVVRTARLQGLLCAVRNGPMGDGMILEISGPLALFRRTLLYGRTLGRLVPLLAWCQRFRLRADCQLRQGQGILELSSGDPIFPAAEPRLYDSQVEARFARDFRRLATDWDVVREPEPLVAGDGRTLLFPDFALQHRRDPGRRWLLEIVGFWTAEYLQRKLTLLRGAKLTHFILCIDEERGCSTDDFPPGALVLRYRRRIDAQAVVKLIECSTG